MTRTLLVVLAAALGIGCGPHWDGTYSGFITYTDSCGGSEQDPESWTVIQNGGVVTIRPLDTTCGDFTADLNGSNAVLRSQTCDPLYDPTTGYTYQQHLTGGAITMQGEHLTGSETYIVDFYNGPSYPYSYSCSGTAALDLFRH